MQTTASQAVTSAIQAANQAVIASQAEQAVISEELRFTLPCEANPAESEDDEEEEWEDKENVMPERKLYEIKKRQRDDVVDESECNSLVDELAAVGKELKEANTWDTISRGRIYKRLKFRLVHFHCDLLYLVNKRIEEGEKCEAHEFDQMFPELAKK